MLRPVSWLQGSGPFHHLSGAREVVLGRRCSPRALESGELILGSNPSSSIVRAMAIVGWSAVTSLADTLSKVVLDPRDIWVGRQESHDCQKRPPFLSLSIDAMGA
jgi:hypothetical protein